MRLFTVHNSNELAPDNLVENLLRTGRLDAVTHPAVRRCIATLLAERLAAQVVRHAVTVTERDLDAVVERIADDLQTCM